jgi:hypothetical protein
MRRPRLSFIALTAFVSFAVFGSAGCMPQNETEGSAVKWGVHSNAPSANILNLRPGETMEVCGRFQDPQQKTAHEQAAQAAIQQWATAINRWGHFKLNPCGSGSKLVINIQAGNQTGLNYFSYNPGQIYIGRTSNPNFLRAVILHEIGHSFGMCDQYTDAGSANCSEHHSPRQENGEVMGATSANKLQLTPGDIEGVRAAADLPNVPANQEWKQYLATHTTVPGTAGDGPLYVAVYDRLVDQSGLLLSVPASAKVALCPSVVGATEAVPCGSDGFGAIALEHVKSINGRDIYQPIEGGLNLANGVSAAFAATVTVGAEPKSVRFLLNPR